MSHSNDNRTLRLERLETRSLLAAGIFDFAADIGGSDQLHSSDRDIQRSDSSRPQDVAGSAPRSQRNGSHHNHSSGKEANHSEAPRPQQDHTARNQVDHHRNQSGDTRSSGASVLAQPIQSLQAPPLPVANEQVIAPPATVSLVTPLPTPSPVVATAPRLQLPNQTNQADLASATASEVTPSVALVGDSVNESSASEDVATTEQSASSQTEILATSDFQQENSPTDGVAVVVSDRAVGGERVWNSDIGYVDLAPLGSLDPLSTSSNDNRSDNEPWELDLGATRLLRRLALQSAGQQVASERSDDRSDVVDRMMQDWFDGTDGLIALEQVDLPTRTQRLDAIMVDVGLDSTVALHRSINLVAGNITPAISGAALDAIMASLEQTAVSQTQPVDDATGVRIPVAAYPAFAAVATTIAVSARRKRKHPLQSTSCSNASGDE